jgi:sugar lactone lactonase YvrE
MKRNCFTGVLVVATLVLSLPAVRAQQQNSDLSNPTALAFDSSGNLFVASYPNTIIKFSADGAKSTFATGVLGSSGLSFDNAGNLLVLDGDSHSIAKFTPDGTKSIFATNIRNPQGLGCDRAGNLFVSEVGTESILRFTPSGTKSTVATGIRVPRNIAFDGSGNLFVHDALTNSIFKITPDGTKSEFSSGVSALSLISDKAGNLLVGDLSSQSIIKFAPNGSKTTFVAGIPGPAGLAFDKAGNLFVSDQSTNSIFKFAPDGAKTVFYKGPSQPSAAEEEEKDFSAGLPEKYAKNYLIASGTISPDEKFAVIYPTKDNEEFPGGANYVVSLKPFAVLGKLNTKWSYFKNESHGSLNADWSDDSSVALITLDGKWGPHDIFLVELRDGKLSRMTNILAKAHDLLLPDYRKAKAERYNEYFDFIFESEDNPICKLDGNRQVRIDALATTDPKGGGDERVWEGRLIASWDVAQAKFTSQKVTRVFAGVRKHED